MGTIKNGFWKLAFIISPNEFKQLIEFGASLGLAPHKKSAEQTIDDYQIYYNGLIATTPPTNYMQRDTISYISLCSFVGNLHSENMIGFGMNPANMVHWPCYHEAVRINGWAVQITLQKGVAVTVDKDYTPNPTGKYFIYEDINLHSPQSYPLYQQVTGFIKGITKPLRFSAHAIDTIEEIKPPVRISKKAAEDLANSWIFKKYEFEIHSYNLHKL